MANNPLQRTGLLKVSDIMKEKEWLGSENKSLTNLVEANDRLAPYVVINTLNPLNIRTRITTKPYRISSWYDYNHALTEGSTELNGTITGGTMKSMTKGSNESGPGLGLYNNHLKTLTNHLLNCTTGNAAAKSSGNDSFLDVWTRFEVTNAVTAGRGNYYVDNSRAYLQIDLSSISSMRVISKAEILLTCVSNTYTPCKVVLVKYEGGTNFVDYPFYPYSQVISEPVLFATGEQTFTLNSAGVAYLNEKFTSGDKYLRVGLITYDYDFLQIPFIGDNLVQGADSAFTSQGHWQLNNSQTASFTTEIVGTRTLPVMKVFPGTSERMTLILAGSNYSPAISGGTYYFLTWYYRFGQYPANFDKVDFGAYTRSYISGNELPVSFLHPDNPTGMSPEWQNGYAFTSVAAGGDLLINVGGYTYPEDSVNEFAVAGLSIVNPIFLKMLGGKYNTPKLKYYYDGYPGAVSTGSVTGVTSSQATVGGTVTTDGRTAITVSGLCWNTTGTPTTADSKTTNGGTSVTTFSSTATGLTLGQTYYIRPYVTTEVGTYYGTQTSFTTLGLPTVTTQDPTNGTVSTGTFNGNATADGGSAITDRGFVYTTNGSVPVITDNKTSASVPTGTGAFLLNLSGLVANSAFVYKAYATNAVGTTLDSTWKILFTDFEVSGVTVSAATSIAATSATLNGNISTAGNAGVMSRGWYYKLDSVPTTSDTQFVDSPSNIQGAMSETLSGLLKNRTYYVKAFALGQSGKIALSSSSISFTTLATVPSVTTSAATSVLETYATFNGNISEDGGSAVTVRGWYYKVGSIPTSGDSTLFAYPSTGAGSMTATLGGLTKNTTYYAKAWATNSAGTAIDSGYISFTTLSTIPAAYQNVATSVASTTVTLNGNVTDDGGHSVTDRGFVYKAGGVPVITDNKTPASVATGTGSFTKNLTGLAPSTTYYVKVYATNADGTYLDSAYQYFTTSAALTIPTVTTTSPATSITSTGATVAGNVSSDGGASVTTKGICYNTTGTPTTANSIVASGTGTGAISSALSGLSRVTTYYCRAYATNSQGTAYGSQVSFTTLAVVPTVSATTSATSITQSSASTGGNVTDGGGSSITARGVCYATSANPTTSNSTVASTNGTGSFTSSLTGLSASTTYYVRAYASNAMGTTYGTQISFATSAAVNIPTVTTTSPATSITSTTATVAGNVSADGGGTVSGKGICYNTSGTPTTANSTVASGSGTGAISSNLSSLTGSTTYYCRAYATNSAGTAYGSQVSFTTSASATTPTVTTTSPATSIGSTGATVNGNVSGDGGATVTEKGICYSTSANPTTSNSKVTSGTGTGAISSVITGLGSSTTYHCRAYAINSAGTAYGAEVDFTTNAAGTIPTVLAASMPGIMTPTADDVTCGNCRVTSQGSATVTERGVVWSSTNSTPTTSDNKVVSGSGLGWYSPVITGCGPIHIYIRSYAINSAGTAYSSVLDFDNFWQ